MFKLENTLINLKHHGLRMIPYAFDGDMIYGLLVTGFQAISKPETMDTKETKLVPTGADGRLSPKEIEGTKVVMTPTDAVRPLKVYAALDLSSGFLYLNKAKQNYQSAKTMSRLTQRFIQTLAEGQVKGSDIVKGLNAEGINASELKLVSSYLGGWIIQGNNQTIPLGTLINELEASVK